jgi:hypothetical protein
MLAERNHGMLGVIAPHNSNIPLFQYARSSLGIGSGAEPGTRLSSVGGKKIFDGCLAKAFDEKRVD